MTFGAIVQKNGLYALRILGSCGQFTAEELLNLAKLAQKFGKGCVTATSRGTIELEGISETELEEAVAAIQAAGLRLGGTGATVRAVVACKGTACRRGMYDVHALACCFDEQFYGLEVPKKFKIGVFGCINSLGKAMAQDVGIMPSFTKLGCLELYVGGLAGSRPMHGRHIAVPLTQEQAIKAVAFIIDLYCQKGKYPQRLRAVLDGQPELWDEIEQYARQLAAE